MKTTISIPARHFTIVTYSLLLTACGGGGSDGGGGNAGAVGTGSGAPVATTPAPPAAQAPFTIVPGVLSGKYLAGYPTAIKATASPNTTLAGTLYFRLDDDNGVIVSADISANADNTYAVSAMPSATKASGHYTGAVVVNVCKDASCTTQIAGAPFKVPYSIDVISPNGGTVAANVTALSGLANARDWSGFQGDASHTGMVPVTLAPASFTARWTHETPAIGAEQLRISDIATGNGLIYFSTNPRYTEKRGYALFALKEQDGTEAWRRDFSSLPYPSTNAPAFANGRIFMSAGSQTSSSFYAFDAANGTTLFAKTVSEQWNRYPAPAVFGNGVYLGGGIYGGMYGFDANSGMQRWLINERQVGNWTPAVDETHVYNYQNDRLLVNDRITGAPVSQVLGLEDLSFYGITPMLGAANNVIIAGSKAVVNFDTGANKIRWSVGGSYHVGPAYDNKTIFVLRDQSIALQALNEADGSLAWSWTPPAVAGRWSGNVLLTNNLVFVSTENTTFAIDRATHLPVWTYPAGGNLALSSNGVLYIGGQSSITAINTR
ncbi:PQQ-binding-like beta-propeller repeat protein [Massilia forsythiae]|uniref:PQQ-binding-like beta-propeller repeat protein n=1 Tax=Massilia forsythiae TaxID=2728020 RepID=A0A7Z2VYV9_9BURK|nr:PQQ-binding-like beta-propeller repeat protein [Massilia forsythiae]QJE01821.1 PQQ-binding-like beta-propeller repeat protein [Massilia forsythiae]